MTGHKTSSLRAANGWLESKVLDGLLDVFNG
jgi:hypothetical protein